MPEDDGACITIDGGKRPRYFEIEMENRLDNEEQYLTTLFHELIHVEQRLRGTHQIQYCTRTSRTVNKWHGDVVSPETKYMDEPWEIEAYSMEKQLILHIENMKQILKIETFYVKPPVNTDEILDES